MDSLNAPRLSFFDCLLQRSHEHGRIDLDRGCGPVGLGCVVLSARALAQV